MTAKVCGVVTKIVDIIGLGVPEKIPVEFNQDISPE